MSITWQFIVASALLTVFAPACAHGPNATSAAASAAGEVSPKPAPVPIAPATPPAVEVYVSDETLGNIVVVDPERATVIGLIPVGKRPRGVRLSPDGSRLFVALSGSPIGGPNVDESKLPPPDRAADGIGIVDVAGKTLVSTVHAGRDPEAFDLSKDGKTLYVSNEETAEMSVVDAQSGTLLARVKVGAEPEGVTLSPDGQEVYVTSEGDNEIAIIDARSLSVRARVKTAARPRAVAFAPDGRTAFVSAENGGELTVIDSLSAAPIGTIRVPPTAGTPTEPRPMGLALAPDARTLFVSLGRAKSLAMVDVDDRRFVRSIENVGVRPWGIAVSPDGRKVYTANGPSGDLSIVDIASGTIDRRIAVGDSPWGLAVRSRVLTAR